ncbi:hypothetical protein HK102_002040 [Quaeritorhiza haematococci]|nr:hypothetical protein HK102_002040 [Quaeritorhiza haematococci]
MDVFATTASNDEPIMSTEEEHQHPPPKRRRSTRACDPFEAPQKKRGPQRRTRAALFSVIERPIQPHPTSNNTILFETTATHTNDTQLVASSSISSTLVCIPNNKSSKRDLFGSDFSVRPNSPLYFIDSLDDQSGILENAFTEAFLRGGKNTAWPFLFRNPQKRNEETEPTSVITILENRRRGSIALFGETSAGGGTGWFKSARYIKGCLKLGLDVEGPDRVKAILSALRESPNVVPCSLDLMLHLVNLYFENIHPYFPMIDRRKFDKELNGQRSEPYLYMGIAHRQACTMGLHRDLSNVLPDQRERHEYAATWYCLYVMDIYDGIQEGRPFGINDDDVIVSLPDPRKYPEVEGLVWHVGLCEILKRASKIASPKRPRKFNSLGKQTSLFSTAFAQDTEGTSSTAAFTDADNTERTAELSNLEEELDAWSRTLPSHLQYSPPTTSESEAATFLSKWGIQETLSIMHHATRIIIHRSKLGNIHSSDFTSDNGTGVSSDGMQTRIGGRTRRELINLATQSAQCIQDTISLLPSATEMTKLQRSSKHTPHTFFFHPIAYGSHASWALFSDVFQATHLDRKQNHDNPFASGGTSSSPTYLPPLSSSSPFLSSTRLETVEIALTNALKMTKLFTAAMFYSQFCMDFLENCGLTIVEPEDGSSVIKLKSKVPFASSSSSEAVHTSMTTSGTTHVRTSTSTRSSLSSPSSSPSSSSSSSPTPPTAAFASENSSPSGPRLTKSSAAHLGLSSSEEYTNASITSMLSAAGPVNLPSGTEKGLPQAAVSLPEDMMADLETILAQAKPMESVCNMASVHNSDSTSPIGVDTFAQTVRRSSVADFLGVSMVDIPSSVSPPVVHLDALPDANMDAMSTRSMEAILPSSDTAILMGSALSATPTLQHSRFLATNMPTDFNNASSTMNAVLDNGSARLGKSPVMAPTTPLTTLVDQDMSDFSSIIGAAPLATDASLGQVSTLPGSGASLGLGMTTDVLWGMGSLSPPHTNTRVGDISAQRSPTQHLPDLSGVLGVPGTQQQAFVNLMEIQGLGGVLDGAVEAQLTKMVGAESYIKNVTPTQSGSSFIMHAYIGPPQSKRNVEPTQDIANRLNVPSYAHNVRKKAAELYRIATQRQNINSVLDLTVVPILCVQLACMKFSFKLDLVLFNEKFGKRNEHEFFVENAAPAVCAEWIHTDVERFEGYCGACKIVKIQTKKAAIVEKSGRDDRSFNILVEKANELCKEELGQLAQKWESSKGSKKKDQGSKKPFESVLALSTRKQVQDDCYDDDNEYGSYGGMDVVEHDEDEVQVEHEEEHEMPGDEGEDDESEDYEVAPESMDVDESGTMHELRAVLHQTTDPSEEEESPTSHTAGSDTKIVPNSDSEEAAMLMEMEARSSYSHRSDDDRQTLSEGSAAEVTALTEATTSRLDGTGKRKFDDMEGDQVEEEGEGSADADLDGHTIQIKTCFVQSKRGDTAAYGRRAGEKNSGTPSGRVSTASLSAKPDPRHAKGKTDNQAAQPTLASSTTSNPRGQESVRSGVGFVNYLQDIKTTRRYAEHMAWRVKVLAVLRDKGVVS